MVEEKANLLLVDDDPTVLRLLSRWLEAEGYLVRTACDGKQALELIETECPQIVVTDWEMPQVNGIDLCRWIRSTPLPHYVYVLFLTVRVGDDDIVRGLEAGADDFLKKPVEKNELLARLRAGARLLNLERRLSHLAKCDPLTGLATQRTLFEELEREWERSRRRCAPLSCAMVDVDFFKRINDTHGHAAGDDVIRHISRLLEQNCRRTDLVSRYGGEEFCVMLPDTREAEAAVWADRVRQLISRVELTIDNCKIRVTASFGVAQRLDDTQLPAELVDMADQALLVAKRSGRDRVVEYRSITETDRNESLAGSPGSMFGGIRAGDVMTTLVAALPQSESAGHAAEYFLRLRINSAPVVDDSGRLVGILAEKDVMAIMLWPNWWKTRVGDIMKRNVVCYEENASVQTIYEFLCRVAIRGVVIVRDGRPTGIISRGSVLRWFTNTMLIESPPPHEGLAPSLCDPPQNVRKCLSATAGAVQVEARHLALRLQQEAERQEMVPAVVGSASRMQELVSDLLAYSRYLNGPWCNGVQDFFPHRQASAAAGTQQGLVGLLGTTDAEAQQLAASTWTPEGTTPASGADGEGCAS